MLRAGRFGHSSLRLSRLGASALNGQRRLQSSKASNQDQLTDEIEEGVKRLIKGRTVPEEYSDHPNWRAVIDNLRQPNRDSLLPLKRDVGLDPPVYPKLDSLKQSGSGDVSERSALREVIDTLKLVGKVVFGSGVLTKRATVEPIDILSRAQAVDSWDTFSPELEATLTRLQDLEEGEELTILGGGISGLSLAWFVASCRPDIKVRVLEASERVGGFMNTEQYSSKEGQSTFFEWGPRTLLPSHVGTQIAVQLAQKLGIYDSSIGVVYKSDPVNTRGLIFDDKVMQLPKNFMDAVKLYFGPFFSGMRLAPVKDLFFARPRKIKVDDESVESYVSRRFNNTMANRLFSAIFRGIYGGDISELSARSITRMNKLYMLERTKKTSIIGAMMTGVYSNVDAYSKKVLPLLSRSVIGCESTFENAFAKYSLITFKNGIDELPRALARSLEKDFNNVKVQLSSPVSAIKSSNEGCTIELTGGKTVKSSVVVSTLPAKDISPCLSESPEAQRLTKEVKFVDMGLVNFYFPKKNVAPEWFGFLAPKTETGTGDVLGVVFDSATRNAAVDPEPLEKEREQAPMPFVPKAPDANKKSLKERLSAENMRNFLVDQLDDGTAPKNRATRAAPGENSEGTTLTVMLGGPLWDGRPLPSAEDAIKNAEAVLKKYLGVEFSSEDYVAKAQFQRQCIPQYRVGHNELIENIHENVSKAYHNRLFLSGTSFGKGVGIGDCLVDSLTIATRFSPQRRMLYPQFYINHYMDRTYPNKYA